MVIFDKICKKMFNLLAKKIINSNKFEISKVRMDGRIDIVRCKKAYNELRNMISEIESGLEDKFHLYLLDIWEEKEGEFYVIDNNDIDIYNFNSDFCMGLFRILCKECNRCFNHQEIRLKEKSIFLDIEAEELLAPLIEDLIKDINKKSDNEKKIYDDQYLCFSEVKIEKLDNNSYMRFYGIGYDKFAIDSGEKKILLEISKIMLDECIGYIESLVDRNVLNTLRIMQEYVNRILPKYGVVVDADLITALASEKYESEECKGKIVFNRENEENEIGTPLIQFDQIEINKEKLRIIRKLLEMSSDKYVLLARTYEGKNYIYGMDDLIIAKTNSNNAFLEFIGDKNWRLSNENGVLLERKDEKYRIVNIKYIEPQIEDSLCKFLGTKQRNGRLEKIINTAKGQVHGTMIIVVKKDKSEDLVNYFDRRNRGIKLSRKVDLVNNESLLLRLSAIDGALIIDSDGQCHAIGVIVDGIANKNVKCNMARGSRYNSALTFINTEDFINVYGIGNDDCIVFVFSEDKIVDVLTYKGDTQQSSYDIEY